MSTAISSHRHPLRFLIVGGVNTAFGLAIYPALLLTGIGYMGALALAQAVSLAFAYTTQKLWVFRTRGDVPREFARFASFYLGIYAANWVALPLLVEVAHFKPWIAQLGFAVATVIGSWFWHTRLTFRAR